MVEAPKRVRQFEEAPVPDWNIVGIEARIADSKSGDPAERRFLFDVKVRRRSNFYIWRVLVPLTLLVFA
jgi:hypothetical protein